MLKILVINEVSPQKKNRTSIIFEKIIPILSENLIDIKSPDVINIIQTSDLS